MVGGDATETAASMRQETTAMDTTTFDSLARLLGRSTTRRNALRGLGFGAATLVAGGALIVPEKASAKRRRKKKHHQCGRHGDGCGALDEYGHYSPPYCCHGYECVYSSSNGSSSWTCQPPR